MSKSLATLLGTLKISLAMAFWEKSMHCLSQTSLSMVELKEELAI